MRQFVANCICELRFQTVRWVEALDAFKLMRITTVQIKMSHMTTSQRRSHTAINCDHTRELNANPFATIPKTICIWFYYFLSLICLLSAEGFIVNTFLFAFRAGRAIKRKIDKGKIILHSDANTNMIEIKIHTSNSRKSITDLCPNVNQNEVISVKFHIYIFFLHLFPKIAQ